MIQNNSFFNKLNELGKEGTAFLFVIDFEGRYPEVYPLSEIPDNIRINIPGFKHGEQKSLSHRSISIIKHPVPLADYLEKFEKVTRHINNGDTYLINLTQPTRVETELDLEEIYRLAKAPYKLYFRDKFVVFSPESFIRIKSGKISTYPMKGTIDCEIPNAEEKLLKDPKEISEHNTIVDLMRNDLSMVAKNVKVERFRYIEKIRTNEKDILQASSEITGILPSNYPEMIGDILAKILPAGSISGAPKAKTVEILLDCEAYERSYYTGIFGLFDGLNLDSAVMIRYVEKDEKGLVFKSGGGITFRSIAEKEYQEMIDKVQYAMDWNELELPCIRCA